jgi:hypothetical protein
MWQIATIMGEAVSPDMYNLLISMPLAKFQITTNITLQQGNEQNY